MKEFYVLVFVFVIVKMFQMNKRMKIEYCNLAVSREKRRDEIIFLFFLEVESRSRVSEGRERGEEWEYGSISYHIISVLCYLNNTSYPPSLYKIYTIFPLYVDT